MDDSTTLRKLSLLIAVCEGRLSREAADSAASVLDIARQGHELAHRLRPVGHVELLKHALHVILDSERTDVEDQCDFGVGSVVRKSTVL